MEFVMDKVATARRDNSSQARRQERSAWSVLVAVLIPTAVVSGCGRSALPPQGGQEASPAAVRPQALLERMFTVYRDCNTYADNAVYRERWVLREEGVVREPPPQMVSVSLERPAKVRIVRRVPDADGNIAEQVTVISNGTRMYHMLPQYPRQILETVAPLELTADNIVSAPQVSEKLLFLPLEDSFAQLDLLLSKAPQDAALAADSSPTLLEEALLGERPCYRIALSSNAGLRIYWIDKKSHMLLRLDLPPGRVREALDPDNQLQEFEQWIEFLDATVGRNLPAGAFELTVPNDAVVVRKWVEGYPGPEPSGPDVSPEERKLYAARLAKYEADLAAASTAGPEYKVEVAVPEIAPRSEPQSGELVQAWQADGLAAPGNLIAVETSPDPRIFVLDGGKSIVELTSDGRLVTRHDLPVLQNGPMSQLRTVLADDKDESGKRWFATSGPGQQRVHVFDATWQHVWSFPEHDHHGIGDVVFAPLGNEAEPQLIVGFWGDLGTHGVSMAGQRVWVDRSLQEVLGLALASDEKQNPVVWTAHGRDVLGRVGKGGPMAPLSIPGRAVVDLAAEDLDGDGQQEFCGLAFVELGVYDAVGLDVAGRELWAYRLPKGEFRTPTRRIVAGQVGTRPAWVIPAADGSIHFVSVDGELIDQFNYGKAITGIEHIEHADQALLLVASPDGLVAWRLEPKN
jgi:outer membrane lipoprotein-sorting protein